MSDVVTVAPWDGAPFELAVDWSQPTDAAFEAAGLDFVHFFFTDALASGALPVDTQAQGPVPEPVAWEA